MYYEQTYEKTGSIDPVKVATRLRVCGVENGSSISKKGEMWLVIKKS